MPEKCVPPLSATYYSIDICMKMYLQFSNVHWDIVGYFGKAQIPAGHFGRFMAVASTVRR